MINELEEVQWAYLISPTFQIENSAGKPLTDGWIEVYIHGTRTKYYCASDFNGTLHPFKIALDSLGSNIVLASPAHSYDIYVYNKYGSLVMSRYNVVPATGDGTVVKDVVNISSDDNSVSVSSTDQTNWNLSIKDTVDRVSQNEQDISDIESTLSNKKDKQASLEFTGSATKTIKKITQNANGEMNVEFEDIDGVSIAGTGIYYTSDGKLTTVEPESNFIDITDEWQFMNEFRLQYYGQLPGYSNDMRILYSPVSDTVKFTSSCRINRTSEIINAWNIFLQYKGNRFYTSHNAPSVDLAPSIGATPALGGIQYVNGTNKDGNSTTALLKFSYVGSPNDSEDISGLAIAPFLNNNNPSIYGCILQNLILKVHKKI